MPISARKRRNLEILLEKVNPHPSPKWRLEQYTIPAGLAAKILWTASKEFRDIEGKSILDMGCGTGRLAVGAALLGARFTVGVDIDTTALSQAKSCSASLETDGNVDWVRASLPFFACKGDVVVQNPPFGTMNPKADSLFLQSALSNACVVYSLHKRTANSRRTLSRAVSNAGVRITDVWPMIITIPHLFKFHRKRFYRVDVDLFRIVIGER